MLRSYLKEAFSSFHTGADAWQENEVTGGRCNAMLTRAIEHVVDETDTRIRAVPRYTQSLGEPVEKVFRLINTLVEDIPAPVTCRRSAYTQDDTVRALFAGPDHLQKVFSESENVRSYFHENAASDDCWALLCMQKEERTRTGMSQVSGRVVRDVLQTAVSFTDHQLMSPGVSEEDARCALKSCIFNSLLAHAKQEARSAVAGAAQQEARLKTLKNKLTLHDKADVTAGLVLENQIRSLEESLVNQPVRLMTPADHLTFVIRILEQPEQYVSEQRCRMRLNNTNVLLDINDDSGNEIELSEIKVASHSARVALLVQFPRSELLPTPDFSRMADIFLAN